MPRGGRRPGAGRPKGTTGIRQKQTLEKEEARKILREMVLQHMRPMVEAQVEHAKGLKYLVVRDKRGGKFIRVTEAMARAKQGSDEEIIEVWEKDPSVQAFTDLMNRAIDKPAEPPHAVDVTFPQAEGILKALEEGRKRVNALRGK